MGALSVLTGQDANWDFKNYHFYNGYAFLHGRLDLDIQPAQLQSYYNPTLDAAIYLAAAHAPPVVVGFALGAVQGLNLWLLYRIACLVLAGFAPRMLFIAALACAVLGVFGAMGVAELGTSFHDLTTCPFVLGAVLILLRPHSTVREARVGILAAVTAGALLGFGAGLKYTLIVYALGAIVAGFVVTARWSQRVLRSAAFGGGVVVGVACSAGHWMLRLSRHFRNPMFPYYNALFESPYTEPVSYVDNAKVPTTFGRALAFPFQFTLDGRAATDLPFRDLRFATAYVLAICVVALWVVGHIARRRLTAPMAASSDAGVWILAFFGASYVVWLKQWAIYRYIAPLEQLAPLVILLLASTIIRERNRLTYGAVAGFAALGVTMKAPDYGRVSWGKDFLGVKSPQMTVPRNTTVVMTSDHPIAYVIPAFPKEARFVRIESNFFSPERRTKLSEIVAEALRPVDRDYRLLTVYDSVERSASLLAVYELAVVGGSCVPLESKFDADIIYCRLRKTSGEDANVEAVSPVAFGAAARAAGMSGRLVADPDPVPVCDRTRVGATTLSWTALGTSQIEIRVGAPNGTLWAQDGPQGSGKTGEWVGDGTTFYLQNVAHGAALTPSQTLARLTLRTVGGGTCP